MNKSCFISMSVIIIIIIRLFDYSSQGWHAAVDTTARLRWVSCFGQFWQCPAWRMNQIMSECLWIWWIIACVESESCEMSSWNAFEITFLSWFDDWLYVRLWDIRQPGAKSFWALSRSPAMQAGMLTSWKSTSMALWIGSWSSRVVGVCHIQNPWEFCVCVWVRFSLLALAQGKQPMKRWLGTMGFGHRSGTSVAGRPWRLRLISLKTTTCYLATDAMK